MDRIRSEYVEWVIFAATVPTPNALISRFPALFFAPEIWSRAQVNTPTKHTQTPMWTRRVDPLIRSDLIRPCRHTSRCCDIWFHENTGCSIDDCVSIYLMRTCENIFTNAFCSLPPIFFVPNPDEARVPCHRRPQSHGPRLASTSKMWNPPLRQ